LDYFLSPPDQEQKECCGADGIPTSIRGTFIF
jgi:hypothetical protein